jgi:hypothetical protein
MKKKKGLPPAYAEATMSGPAAPELLFYGDLDGSGTSNLVEAYFMGEYGFPHDGLDKLAQAMPSVRARFPTYAKYAAAPIDDLFGMDRLRRSVRREVNTLESDGDVIQQHLDKIFPALFRRILAPVRYWRYVRLPADRALDRSVLAVKIAIEGFIAQARERIRQEPDRREHPRNLLEAMIAASDLADSGVTDREVAGNVLTMLLAGEDTTANTLAWMAERLARHPDALEQCHRDALDGGGRYLQVSPGGGRSWILRYAMAGKRREMGLGPYPTVSLAVARQSATEARALVKARQDPIAARDTERVRQRLEEADPVHSGHHQVGDDDGWLKEWRPLERVFAINRFLDLVSPRGEEGSQGGPRRVVVVRDQYPDDSLASLQQIRTGFLVFDGGKTFAHVVPIDCLEFDSTGVLVRDQFQVTLKPGGEST